MGTTRVRLGAAIAMLLATGACGGDHLSQLSDVTLDVLDGSMTGIRFDFDPKKKNCLVLSELRATLDDVELVKTQVGGPTTVWAYGLPNDRCDQPQFALGKLPRDGAHTVRIFDSSAEVRLDFHMNGDFTAHVAQPADGRFRTGEQIVIAYQPDDAEASIGELTLDGGQRITLDWFFDGKPKDPPGQMTVKVDGPVWDDHFSPGIYPGTVDFRIDPTITNCTATQCFITQAESSYDMPAEYEVLPADGGVDGGGQVDDAGVGDADGGLGDAG